VAAHRWRLVPTPSTRSRPECIRLRGARQNNLRGFDLEIPLGRYVVVTGLSGSGKSSLVFDTLHAEGQRRYVETFSAYTRQFLDLLPKPAVDSVENIRPSIAIEQTNTVRTSRSTVGTMTELTAYFKVCCSHVAECLDPVTGERVEDDNPATIWSKALEARRGESVLVTFRVTRPKNLSWPEILRNLKSQSYVRALVPGPRSATVCRIDELADRPRQLSSKSEIHVIQDRLTLVPGEKSRFMEAVEAALHFGQGTVRLFPTEAAGTSAPGRPPLAFSRGLHSPTTGRTFRAATPALFSFNSPLGACPRCRGFGRIIEIDYRLALPDQSLSIDDGAIRCWESDVYGDSKTDLLKFTRRRGIPTDVPFSSLTREQRDFVIDGDPKYAPDDGRGWPKYWYGIKGFFRWLEKNTYKMHVRVFLSRYRAYNPCPDCGGTRLQPEALCWKWSGRTLPELYRLPISELLPLLAAASSTVSQSAIGNRQSPIENIHSAAIALDSILTRLRYLGQVGLGYLTLDRASRTLSGGEVQRVNLTSCLGTSLVDTLFVLDEPSVGLHARDTGRLLEIIRSLTDAGNTVIVVEHDEAMIRAADHVIEIGPGPGSQGGSVVFSGSVPDLLTAPSSLTGAWLSGRRKPAQRGGPRKVDLEDASQPRLTIRGATKHNIRNLSLRLPLRRLVCLSGISGSGKSTLMDNVILQGLLGQRFQLTEDPAEIESIATDIPIGEIVSVDQSPLSRTPRSNAALYCGAWELIREVFAATPAAQEAGFTASSFSFNAGDGRCEKCLGLGYERVEMQFLSDVFVPCPACDGRRFRPELLAVRWEGRSVADILGTSVSDALSIFSGRPEIVRRLSPLDAVGLGYLTLGQPLNTLSGGECQRLKLVRHLGGYTPPKFQISNLKSEIQSAPALLLLDEPTTGLHRQDVARLLDVLHALVDQGNSVVVIEHNLDVLRSADWIVEIGPGAGNEGGRIVAEGTPDEIARDSTETSPYLRADPGLCQLLDDKGLGRVSEDRPRAEPPAEQGHLTVTGAREHNLRELTLQIPHRQLSVVTGVSGSGKSTLAFDIVFAEGQRRFMESMSPYARQFVEQLPRPDVDRVSGIPPAVAIEQRVTRGSRKSTVATITEVAQYLRLLFARLGVQHHPESGRPVTPLSRTELNRLLLRILRAHPLARRAKRLFLCAPVVRGRKGHHQPIADWARRHGYERLRVDGRIVRVSQFQKLDRYREHDVEVVVADLREIPNTNSQRPKQSQSRGSSAASIGEHLDAALSLGKGSCLLATERGAIVAWLSTTRTDAQTGESFPELDPKHFSFNSPRGWCPSCRGHGRIYPWMLEPDEDDDDDPAARLREFGIESEEDVGDGGRPCPDCGGARLNRVSRAVRLPLRKPRGSLSLPELLALTPARLIATLRRVGADPRGRLITRDILPQIEQRLGFLDRVGLGYLTLDRPTATLSGGEAQRIRLAAQLGSNLTGVLYVLDEPSIGLHVRDNERLIGTLESLRDKGNTLLVVEHDDETMSRADHIIDLGPGAGAHGGRLLASGTPAEIRSHSGSLTGAFLSRGIPHPLRGSRRSVMRNGSPPPDWLVLERPRFRNLRGFDLRLPLGRLILIAGPSGAGKSSLFRDLLVPAVVHASRNRRRVVSGREFLKASGFEADDGIPPFSALRRADGFRSVIEVDQSPIGKTPRSTPATYLGIFDLIRKFFASLPESRLRGYTASRFSFNLSGGRCPTCEGAGRIRLEMAFMPDTYLPCDDCRGLRYGTDLADITWKGKNIGEVLQLTFEEAADFFDFHSQLSQVCRLMIDCGLGYLTLGQSSPTLSGGEAQRLKLVTELSRGLATYRERSRGSLPRNFYLLEEPTIGLHLSDCEKLIRVLHSLVDQGHTVVVIEHHLDLIEEADYVVELGPGGGPEGGRLIYQGGFDGLSKVRTSPTAPFLRRRLRSARTEPPVRANSDS